MKKNIIILPLSLLLTSCDTRMPSQELEVVAKKAIAQNSVEYTLCDQNFSRDASETRCMSVASRDKSFDIGDILELKKK